jgi:peptide/nickel transport system substrate-binding protein
VTVSAALLLTACSTDSPDTAAPEGSTIVIDKAFDLVTADPGRMYEPTGQLIDKALYETLLDFDGSDVATPVPGLATLEQSDDAKTFTFTLEEGHTFSDGSPVEADDVVFSLERVIGMKGNPSFLLAGVTVEKQDEQTIVLTTEEPTPALPYILPNPALGILNSEVVIDNGGTTDETDAAEEWLNANSAGSGPYVLESLDLTSQVVLAANDEYSGDAPAYSRVVVRNVDGPTQKINIEGGDSQLALDLSGDQVSSLADGVDVQSEASANVIFLLLNQNDEISEITSNPDFVSAVKKAIDYADLVEFAGTGTSQAYGVIPSMFLGALGEEDALTSDLDGAKADLEKSGYDGEPVTLNFPSDVTLNGVEFTVLAQRIQSQLEAAGITIELAPAPVATEIETYRNGEETIGLWYWGPDYPDPSDYLVFTPGDLVGLRAGWEVGMDDTVSGLADAARVGGSPEERTAQFSELQKALNESGPFVPLLQPGNNIAFADTVTDVAYNAVWTIDIADLG